MLRICMKDIRVGNGEKVRDHGRPGQLAQHGHRRVKSNFLGKSDQVDLDRAINNGMNRHMHGREVGDRGEG